MNDLGIIVPVFNEALTIGRVLEKVLSQPDVAEVVVVDDASTDGSASIVEQLATTEARLQLIRHSTNRGKGAALRSAFGVVSADIVIIQDADLEYDPAEYGLLAAPIRDERADVVFGSRFIGSQAHRVLYFWHSVGNKLLTLLSNMTTNLNLTDMETGFKAFRRGVIQKITIQEERFGFEPEVTAKVARMKARIYEVAISYHGRTYEDGKKIGWRDGVRAVWCIVKYAFRRHPDL